MSPKAPPLFARLTGSGVRTRARRERMDEGRAHPCGLTHRSTCEGWSWMAAILWWLLRNDSAGR